MCFGGSLCLGFILGMTLGRHTTFEVWLEGVWRRGGQTRCVLMGKLWKNMTSV